jgi:hypothetical protein
MPTCFVIQPFDSGRFDKRFEDVYEPAIIAAGLEAYRVDRDPRVDVPIDAIEDGIRSAAICLADITTDNPNVWYELGFAFAAGKPVVMVCAEERSGKKYPFDIQHRTVIPYLSEAPRDFEKLRTDLTARLTALLEKGEALRHIAESEQVAPVEGLSQPELFVLASVAGSVMLPEATASLSFIKNDVEGVGLTNIGFSLGVRRLKAKGFIEISLEQDREGDRFEAIGVTETGWSWIEAHESLFLIRRPGKDTSG